MSCKSLIKILCSLKLNENDILLSWNKANISFIVWRSTKRNYHNLFNEFSSEYYLDRVQNDLNIAFLSQNFVNIALESCRYVEYQVQNAILYLFHFCILFYCKLLVKSSYGTWPVLVDLKTL